MEITGLKRLVTVSAFVLIAASCAWIPKYVSEPGVSIELVPASTGRIASAHFWEDSKGFALRGEVVPIPVTKGPLFGHVDIAVTNPETAAAECSTTRQRIAVRKVRKPYSKRFDQLPAAGSIVRVWHHDAPNHEACSS
tara:strand:+ start:5097 stop:5510 length:414 start_codon:yes stop_codon:yes gene_type:complete